MKTIMNLIPILLWVSILALLAPSCNEDETSGGAELSALSYATGEVALADADYVSAVPSLFSTSKATFSIVKVSQNGQQLSNTAPEIMTINPNNGVITAKVKADPSYAGEYFVSVNVKNSSANRSYADVFRLIVKGISYESDLIKVAMGEAKKIPVKDIHVAQPTGTKFYLAIPKGSTSADYTGITVDSLTCELNIDAKTAAGVYPISIKIVNLTNAAGSTLDNVTTIAVESKPYDLVYSPSSITLITKEGHISVAPKVKAASAADGANVTYALGNNPDNQFSINAATGVITLVEDNLLPAVLKTYSLTVKVSNSMGESSFADAYTVIIDPNKKIDPITAATYSDTFPVALRPGQPWTSSRAVVTGSTVGLAFSLIDAPQGVTINAKTGVITMAEGHRMPLLLTSNNLKVSVLNSGMATGLAVSVGTFAVNPVLWSIVYGENTKDNSREVSGITNMDRYSFMGTLITTTSIQVKNAFGKSSAGNYLDILGVNTAGTPAGNTNQNNDWMVSEAITLDSYCFNPSIKFALSHAYGTLLANILEVYMVEINASNVYIKGAQEQVGDLNSTPSSLAWTQIATNLEGATSSLTNFKQFSMPIDAQYKGKTIRIAVRYYNPSAGNNNSRTYRIDNLRIEDTLVP